MEFAVIMAGGRGERLWPLSTPEQPKQFLRLFGEETMLQATVNRILPLIPWENIYVVTSERHGSLVHEQLPSLPPENIITEPIGRSTAPCIGLAATLISHRDPHGTMVVLPADHVIRAEDRFRKLIKAGLGIASDGEHLITLGITPRHPATGYGYIQGGEVVIETEGIRVLRVKRFTEKPDYETAVEFLNQGGYFWNSGMFIWRVDTILEEIREHLPDLHAGLRKIMDYIGRPDHRTVLADVYAAQESISIDNGVMEKSTRALVIPTGEIGWSDVGDWAAWAELFPRDEAGNVIQAQHVGIDTQDSVILSRSTRTDGRVIATLGVSDLVIIETDDAVLVMDKNRAQEVKRLLKLTRP